MKKDKAVIEIDEVRTIDKTIYHDFLSLIVGQLPKSKIKNYANGYEECFCFESDYKEGSRNNKMTVQNLKDLVDRLFILKQNLEKTLETSK
jgi:hypothetical protein